ncbi:MAG TPA: hypothetical protein VGM75_07970 [Pseudonocardiaceae bacterium]
MSDTVTTACLRASASLTDRIATLIGELVNVGDLKAGLSTRDAIDIAWTLNNPRTYLMLVAERGWSPERYEQWLSGALRRELLD